MLIGSFGSGKSKMGNILLGKEVFASSESWQAVTTKAVEESSNFLGKYDG